METFEIEAFTGQANYAVIRPPGEEIPGVVVQGDSLFAFIADLHRGLEQLRQGMIDDGIDEVADVLDRLEEVQRSYEHVLSEHSIPLLYSRE